MIETINNNTTNNNKQQFNSTSIQSTPYYSHKPSTIRGRTLKWNRHYGLSFLQLLILRVLLKFEPESMSSKAIASEVQKFACWYGNPPTNLHKSTFSRAVNDLVELNLVSKREGIPVFFGLNTEANKTSGMLVNAANEFFQLNKF